MAWRIMRSEIRIGTVEVVIHQDSEYGEFRCRLIVDRVPYPAADYFTDDQDDARHTAWKMARYRVMADSPAK